MFSAVQVTLLFLNLMERKQSEKVLDFEEFIVSLEFNVLFTIILLCYFP